MGHLKEFLSSSTGQRYYNTLNGLLDWLAPGKTVQTAAAFGQACMVDAKTILMLLPRERTPDIMRFNASCKLFANVYKAYGAAEWNVPQLDGFYKANANFTGSQRTVLHVGDEAAINDASTDAAADVLFVGAKVRNRYRGIDTRLVKH